MSSSSKHIIKAAKVFTNFVPPTDMEPQEFESYDPPANEEESGETEETLESDGEPQKIIAEARARAEKILTEAMVKEKEAEAAAAEKGYSLGYEAGFKEGYEASHAECSRELGEELGKFRCELEATLGSVEQIKDESLKAYLEELKNISVAVAEKVIHISLESSGEVMKRMIVAEAEKLKKAAWVKIYIEKYDYELMMKTDADVIEQLSHLSDNIRFIIMDKNERGSCIIEMPDEIVDVSVSTQIGAIKDIIESLSV